jgi:hypothetical protein
MTSARPVPAVSFQTARSGASTNANELRPAEWRPRPAIVVVAAHKKRRFRSHAPV